MEIVTGEPAATVEPADAVRLLHEMAAVVRTIFVVDAALPVVPSSSGAAAGAGTPRTVAAVAAIAAVPSVAVPAVALGSEEPPASIPVPGAAILQEIAFLDDRP